MSRGIVHRYLDPTDTLLEVLFGLIMALTLTAGARLLPESSEVDAAGLASALLGCNLAWGVIDAVFYLLGTRFNRNRRVQLVRRLRAAKRTEDALAAVREEFSLEGEPEMHEQDRAAFHASVLNMLQHAGIAHARLLRKDLIAAGLIVVLVTATAVPGVVPLLLIDDPFTSLRVANLVQIGLLFVVGHRWAHHSGADPWRTGAVIALLGVGLVLVAVALGG